MENPHVFLTVYWILISLAFQLAVASSVVRFLPGFEGPLPFELETGYVGVDESEDVQLFYYFIKSERNPEEDPLMIWLTGGPACSAISSLVYEIGPIFFKLEEYNGSVPTLVPTSYSWTKVASIIFLDSPAGSGFSYGRTPLASQPSDLKQVYQIDEFIRKWLVNHPEFISNPFYVGGDSYAGKIVPAVVQHIAERNEQGKKPLINLQGYLAGNPMIDASSDFNSRIPYAHGMGLISDELYQSLERSCGGEYDTPDPQNTKCLKDLQAYNKCISRIYTGHILIPYCDSDYVKLKNVSFGQRRDLTERLTAPHFGGCYTYRYLLSAYWANDEQVRKALGVKKGSIGEWVRCNQHNIPYAYDIPSAFPYHVNNSVRGLRSLIYSGDHDIVVPFIGTQAWIRALNYSIVSDWRPWMINDQVAGYTRTYANQMTFATIKGGGHTAEYSPTTNSVMFRRWINGDLL